jgi:hypothetical protein
MKPITKIAIVIGGYVAAAAVAYAVLSIYIAFTASPDRDQYAAMWAFGDSLLFLGVFVLAALPATGAALYFLRPYRPFWMVLSALALANAALGVVSIATFFLQRGHANPNDVGVGITFAILRILVAPAFAPVLFACGFFAPESRSRLILLGSAATEVVVFGLYLTAFVFRPR